MFYVPFEPYSVHFAMLPWLVWAQLRFLASANKKNLIFLIVINFIAIPQNYVGTFFLVYILGLSLVNLSFIKNWQYIKRIILLYITITIVNAFWLLPNIYFVVNKIDVNVNSKINQMATEDVFLRNKNYGDLGNTSLLRGFWFDNIELDKEGIWRLHQSYL